MSELSLHAVVRDRLASDLELSAGARELLDARTPSSGADDAAGSAGSGGGAYFLSSIEVTGFRGIGPTATLDLVPGPGLTVIAGRNGAGKSSFADALEFVLTGSSFRWQGKGSTAWRSGWANLHHDGDRRAEVAFVREGSADELRVCHEWAPSDDLGDGTTSATRGSERLDPRDLGWESALETFRPFLPYGELESMLSEGPSRLYDALAGILGLEELTSLSSALAADRKQLETRDKEVKAELERLLVLLAESNDPRSDRCTAALKGRAWKLDEVDAVLSGAQESADPTSEINRARQLINVLVPSEERVATAVAELAATLAAVQQWVGTDADRALRTARLLEQALELHDHVGDSDCPVCGAGSLDAAWRSQAAEQIRELDRAAGAASSAQSGLADARAAMVELVRQPDVLLSDAATWPVDVSGLHGAWSRLAEVAALDDESMLTEVGPRCDAVRAEAEDVASRAETWMRAHDDAWRPIAEPLTAWLSTARRVIADRQRIADSKEAERWLADLTDELRAERFAPIRSKAIDLFTTMRATSNVSLEGLDLVGKATRRRLELDVAVDGQDGAGVAVMSQGELNALALSLFLPRATLPDSPFGFVVIDDPVQSMDPSRVDGLARALEKVAAQRQVVVFTHDDRLPESIRSLGIEATILQVQRRKNSEIEVRPVHDPARQYLADANFVRRMTVPAQVQQAVVPSLLRQAIEAASQTAIRRRRLAQGVCIDDIDAELRDLQTVDLVGLVLLDRPADKSEIYEAVRNRFSAEWATALSECNSGAHGGTALNLEQLSTRAGKLARKLQESA